MVTEENMSIEERYQYLRRMQTRYQGADRQTKKQLLDEIEIHTGMHRKSLIRRLGGTIQRQPRSRERDKEYGPEAVTLSFDRTLAASVTLSFDLTRTVIG